MIDFADLKRLTELARRSAGLETTMTPEELAAAETKLAASQLAQPVITAGGQFEPLITVEEGD